MGTGGLSKARLARMHDVMAGYIERGEVPVIVTLPTHRLLVFERFAPEPSEASPRRKDMSAGSSAAAQPEGRVLRITRVFDAPRSLVFKAWTEPERLVRWWGPQGFTTPFCKMDVCPGGAYRFGMRSAEGTEHWLHGVYREILEPERLVFTWAWEDAQGKLGPETVLSLDFAEHAGKTKLTLHQALFETVTARNAHQLGWTTGLDRLADYLAKVKGERV